MQPTSCQPRYAMLAATLKQLIDQGHYPVGSSLPTEANLCEQFNVSRHTVREALRLLQKQGLIASRQGCGSHVTENKCENNFTHALDSMATFKDFRAKFTPNLICSALQTLEPEHANYVNIDPKRLWLRLKIIWHWNQDNLPSIITDAYIDGKYSCIQKIYNCEKSLHDILEQHYGVHTAYIHQEIRAILLNSEQKKILQANKNTPGIFAIRQCFSDNDEIVVMSFNVAHGDRYIYSHNLRNL